MTWEKGAEMAKFVHLYNNRRIAATSGAREKQMQAWGAWSGYLSGSATDMGHPLRTARNEALA
jgi:hypothetical protein